MKGHNIGRGLSVVHRFFNGCDHDDDFGRAMGAPMGELRHLISRGRARGFRLIRKRVRAITGLKWREFEKEVKRRTNAKWVHYRSSLYDYGQWHGEPIRPSWLQRGY